MNDIIEIIDELGNPTNTFAARKVVHEKKLLHHSVHIWIVNSKNEILLTQRSFQKSNYPGMFHISTGGHRDGNENPVDTAIRELKEELGIKVDKNELIKLDYFYAPVIVNGEMSDNEWLSVFLAKKDVSIDEIKLDPAEVLKFFWMDIDEFYTKMKDKNYYSKFVQQSQEYYLSTIEKITELIF